LQKNKNKGALFVEEDFFRGGYNWEELFRGGFFSVWEEKDYSLWEEKDLGNKGIFEQHWP
jgi:hypothetical protein